jgi:hypothetical protein
MKRITIYLERSRIDIEYKDDEFILLQEAKKYAELGGKYSARFDKAHVPNAKDHIHVLVKNDTIYSINADGTGHDGSTGIRIHNNVADAIRNIFPMITIPSNNIIESMSQASFLIEK